MAVGQITVELLAKTASFSTDMNRSAKDLEKVKKAAYETGRQIGDSINGIAAAVGIGLSVGAFASLIKGSIDAADHLNDLSKKNGIAVDTLGGIGFAAKQAGGDLDSASAAVGKLNKAIAAARSVDKSAAQGFAVLGLDNLIRDGASAEEVLASVADKFAEFEDGPEKAAIALRIFGKAGAEMIPLLDEGGASLRANIEYFKRYSGVTQDVATKADQFNDTQEKLRLLSGAFGNTLAAELLPQMQSLADVLLDAKEKGDGFRSVAKGIAEVLNDTALGATFVVLSYKQAADEIGGLISKLQLLNKVAKEGRSVTDWFGTGAAVGALSSDEFKAIDKQIEDNKKDRLDFLKKIAQAVDGGSQTAGQTPFSDSRFDASHQPKKRAPGLPDPGKADAELKKALDGQIKLIREFAGQEQQAYQFAQKFVDGVFDDGLVSLREKFDTEKQLRDAALASQVKALDDEIAAERTAAKKFSGADRIEIENRIKEAVARRAEVVQKASQEDILAAGQEAREIKALRDSYDDLRSTILDLKGDTAGAAALRNDQAVKAARDLITRAGGDPGLADEYGDLLAKTTQLSQAQRDYNTLLEHSRVQEEALLQVAQDGGATEIDTLRAVGAQRAKSLEQLGAMAAKARELAESLGTPEAIAFAERLGEAFRKASAEVDPLLLKVRAIGQALGQGLGDIFGQAIEQGKGLKAILGDIGTLVQKVLTEELISKPIGKMIGDLLGGTGSSGGLLGSFLGVGKSGGVDASAAATTSSFATLQAVGIEPTISALLRFQTALGTSSSTSAASSSGGSWMDSIGSFFGDLFGGSSSSGAADAGASFFDAYDTGGFTGPGGKMQPAGIVHKGEVVFSQDDVKRAGGVGAVERMRKNGLQGYAGGGYVSDMAARVYGRGAWVGQPAQGGGSGGQPMVVNQSFAISGPADLRTQQQLAAAAGRGVQRAQSRNN